MASLDNALAIASSSLQAQQGGLDVVANNLANVNTPGYSQQVAVLAEQQPFSSSGGGGGVSLQTVQSIRDSVLNIRINQENAAQSQLTAEQNQLNPVQSMFSTSGGAGLGAAIDGFFNSLQQLSTDPSSGAQRQAVITAAGTMAQTFQQVSQGISQQISGADQEVVQGVGQVNTLLGQIATLNNQIAEAQTSPQDAGSLEDQRDTLLTNLSNLMGFTVSAGDNGEVTLTTAGGSPLVVGSTAAQLTLQTQPDGMHDILDNGADITTGISGGSLAGDIQARDQVLPQMASQLDQLAGSISNAVNTQNQAGFLASGAAGGALFTAPPATGAAAQMALATADPNAIAASGTGAAGDNSNVVAMENLQQQGIVGGQTPDGAYAGLISNIGGVLAGVNTQQQASQVVLTQLQNQQSSISGVSTDQESILLQQFQQAYQAAAQVVNVINQLTADAINLGGSTTATG